MYSRGMGQTAAPPVCVFPGSWSDPLCIDAFFSGEYMPGYQNQVPPMITEAQVVGAAPAAPPSQAYIDANIPQDTIDYILSQSQQGGVDQATAAAAAQAASMAAANPPGSLSSWISQNGTLLLIGGGIFLALMALNVVKR